MPLAIAWQLAGDEWKARTLTCQIQNDDKPADSAPGVRSFPLMSFQTALLTKK